MLDLPHRGHNRSLTFEVEIITTKTMINSINANAKLLIGSRHSHDDASINADVTELNVNRHLHDDASSDEFIFCRFVGHITIPAHTQAAVLVCS